jgi:hypothetical protein
LDVIRDFKKGASKKWFAAMEANPEAWVKRASCHLSEINNNNGNFQVL